jgi:ribose-phosphate pyrophosphokinase
VINLSAASILGKYLVQKQIHPLLLGPDSESEQWVQQVASIGDFDWAVANKQRISDIDVDITLPTIEFQNRVVVLVDDVISSGHTLAETAQQIYAAGAAKVCCLVTHALFAEGAVDLLHQAGIEDIWSSDSIPHETNVTQLADMLGDGLHVLLEN